MNKWLYGQTLWCLTIAQMNPQIFQEIHGCTNIPRDICTDEQTYRQVPGYTNRCTDIPKDAQMHGCANRHIETQMCQRTIYMSAQQGGMHAPMNTPNAYDSSYLKLISHLKSWKNIKRISRLHWESTHTGYTHRRLWAGKENEITNTCHL